MFLFPFQVNKVSITSPVRYSCLSILTDNNGDVFYSVYLNIILYFLSLILSSVIIISFHILSKRLSDGRVVPITKKEYGFSVHFLENSQYLMNN